MEKQNQFELIQPFQDLAAQVRQQWKLENFHPSALTEIAARSLERFKVSIPNFDALLELILQGEIQTLDERTNRLELDGGEHLTITLYRDTRFAVELSFSFLKTPEIVAPASYGAIKILRGKTILARYSAESVRESNDFISISPLVTEEISVLPPGSILRLGGKAEMFWELCYCQEPEISLRICSVPKIEAQRRRIHALLPDIIMRSPLQLSSMQLSALQLIYACDRAGGEARAMELYKEFLQSLSDEELLFHHRNAKEFHGIPWLPIRYQFIRQKEWGRKYAKAEEFEREYRINFSYIRDPLHRAMAFILQRDGDLNEFETEFRTHFGMTGTMKENSLNLIDSLSKKQVYRKRIDKTSTDFLRYAVEGITPEKMKEEIQEQFNVDKEDLPINVDQYFANIQSDPIFRRLVRSNGKSN